jgi:undecaprenyl-diphosphatase
MSTSSPARISLRNRLLELWHLFRTRIELRLLIGILLIGLASWLFIELSEEVVEGDTRAVDETILLALRNPADHTDPLGPPWVEEMGRDYTALGGIGVVGLVTGVVCIYLALARRWSTIWLILAVVVGSQLFNQLLKTGFDRPRPDLVPHGMVVYFPSFPSGHAMLSASVYLTLGALLARLQKQRYQAILIMGTAIFVTILVGVNRVYLAVHWPSDVLAGWTAGSIWATICWMVAWELREYRHSRFTQAHKSALHERSKHGLDKEVIKK